MCCLGWAVDESAKRRGLLEDIRMNCELAVSAVFDWLRKSLRWVTRMPQKGVPEGRPKRIIHSHVLPVTISSCLPHLLF